MCSCFIRCVCLVVVRCALLCGVCSVCCYACLVVRACLRVMDCMMLYGLFFVCLFCAWLILRVSVLFVLYCVMLYVLLMCPFVCVFNRVCACCLRFTVMVDGLSLLCVFKCAVLKFSVIVCVVCKRTGGVVWLGCCIFVCVSECCLMCVGCVGYDVMSRACCCDAMLCLVVCWVCACVCLFKVVCVVVCALSCGVVVFCMVCVWLLSNVFVWLVCGFACVVVWCV